MSHSSPISTPGFVPLPTHSLTEPMARLARLQALCLALTAADTVQQAADVVITEGFAALNATTGSIYLLETASPADKPEFVCARAVGYSADNWPDEVRVPLDTPIPLAHAATRRQPVYVETAREYLAEYPHASPPGSDRATGPGALVALPLLVDARVIGGIELHWQQDRAFDADTRAFMEVVAQMCAQVVERAGLYDVMVQNMAQIESANTRLHRSMAETHHRVKNNLQVISALVDLQCDTATSMVSVDALRRIGSHARALATLHDLLTDQAKATTEVNIVSARSLFSKMIWALQATCGRRDLQTSIEDIHLPVRVGAALCLLINELVNNAGKHGGQSIHLSLAWETLPPDTGQTQVSSAPQEPSAASLSEQTLSEQTRLPSCPIARLEVTDDGPGFPHDFDAHTAAHTGLELVSSITRLDLGGQIFFVNNLQGGAKVRVTFPVPTG
jgi:two-component sensor histidine kinase